MKQGKGNERLFGSANLKDEKADSKQVKGRVFQAEGTERAKV